MKVSVVVPILHSEPGLEDVLQPLASLRERHDLEVILVVDVPDPTLEDEARQLNGPIAAAVGASVFYRVGARSFGSALRHGFAKASGEVVIPFMGDACDDPADIPRLIEAVGSEFDIVAGSRYMKGGRIVGNSSKQVMSRAYSRLVRLVGGPRIHDVSNSFKAYRSTVVDSIETVANSFDISVEFTVKAAKAGFRISEIPTVWTNRRLGQSKFRLWQELGNYVRWLILAAKKPHAHAAESMPRRRTG